MKKISIIVMLLGIVSCASSRPKYLRCSNKKRCVEVQFKKHQNVVFINTLQKQQETLIF